MIDPKQVHDGRLQIGFAMHEPGFHSAASHPPQAIDDVFVCVRRLIRDECRDILKLWRQPRQVKRHAPDQRRAIGLRRRLYAFVRQPRPHNRIDGRARGACRRYERPMQFVLRAFRNPSPDGVSRSLSFA